MKKTPRTHLDRGPAVEITSAIARRYLCRPADFLPPDRVTADESAVTCGSCLRMLAEGRAPTIPAEPPPPEPFVSTGPYVAQRGTSKLYVTRERHRTLNGELIRWFRYRLASKVRPAPLVQGERDLAPITDDRARMPNSDRGVVEAHASVHQIDSAITHACEGGVSFAGAADGAGSITFPPAECKFLVVLYLDGKSPADIGARIATRLGLDDRDVTDRQVGLVWRTLRARMRKWMESRRLLESDSGPLARARELQYSGGRGQAESEAPVRVPSKYDLQSWKGIAGYLKCSEATARAKVASLVTRLDNGEIVWTKAAADAYIESRDGSERGAA